MSSAEVNKFVDVLFSTSTYRLQNLNVRERPTPFVMQKKIDGEKLAFL